MKEQAAAFMDRGESFLVYPTNVIHLCRSYNISKRHSTITNLKRFVRNGLFQKIEIYPLQKPVN